MPFGLIFGAVFFIVVFFLRGFLVLNLLVRAASGEGPWLVVLPDVLMTLLMLGLALGLLARQRWARWAGIAVGLLLTGVFGVLTWQRPSVDSMLVLFASAITVILLLVPATGDVRRGMAEGASGRSRFGPVLGYVVAGTLIGFIVTLGLVAYKGGYPDLEPAPAVSGLSLIDWNDYGPGLEKAGAEGKPVLVDFFTDWCGYCKKMDRGTFRDPAVLDALEKLVPVRVDAEGTEKLHGFRGEDLASRFNIETYPTLLLLDSRGNEISRARGYRDAREFLSWLQRSLDRAGLGRAEGVGADPAVM